MIKTFNDKLDDLIDEIVIAFNEPVLDDDYPDTLADWDKRLEAIEYLEDLLTKMKEE